MDKIKNNDASCVQHVLVLVRYPDFRPLRYIIDYKNKQQEQYWEWREVPRFVRWWMEQNKCKSIMVIDKDAGKARIHFNWR